jgi:hypothetical protein
VQPKAAAVAGVDVAAIVAAVLEALTPKLDEITLTVIQCATVMHDAAGMTGGTFRFPKVDEEGNQVVDELGNFVQQYSELYPDQNKILAHTVLNSDGTPTAFNPENMRDVVADVAQAGNGVAYEEEPAEEVFEEEVQEEVAEGE